LDGAASGGKAGSPKHVTHIFKVKAPLLHKNEVLCLTGIGKALNDWSIEKPLLMNREDNWWILKTDSSGNKQWDVDLGGSGYEEFYCASKTKDGGFLLSGDSYSPVSGNKSEANMGTEQTWVVKIDSTGAKAWDKTILTPGHDESGQVLETADGCVVVANWSDGTVGGYKSQPPWNNSADYWIVKFCDTLFIQANLTAINNLCPGTCTDFLNLSFNATSYQWNFPLTNETAIHFLVNSVQRLRSRLNFLVINNYLNIKDSDILIIHGSHAH
jgi:hypothetical protein